MEAPHPKPRAHTLATYLICCACIGEGYLRDEVTARGAHAVCSYCGKSLPTITLGELATRLDTIFDEHYRSNYVDLSEDDCTMLNELEERFGWNSEFTPATQIIRSLANIPTEPAEHLRLIIDASRRRDYERGPDSLDSDTEYIRVAPSNRKMHDLWDRCERSLRTEVRHFNGQVESVLRSMFDRLTQYTTRDGRPVVVNAGPKEPVASLFRARVFHSDAELTRALKYPEEKIGPPPSSNRPNRMSAQGLSVFYGATQQRVALAEVRAPAQSRVMIGHFDLVRQIRLLDLAALRSIYVDGSLLDPEYDTRLRKALFLDRLSQQMTQPVTPDDGLLGYLITQVIADYLADRAEPALDGILYPSVQASGGRNAVLFHKSARVEIPYTPRGTRFQVQLRKPDPETSGYSVLATVPFWAPSSREYEEDEDYYSEPLDPREVTLCLKRPSLTIFHIDDTTTTLLPCSVAITQVDEPLPWFTPLPS